VIDTDRVRAMDSTDYLHQQMADEIDRLRAALTEVVATPLRYCKQVARAALAPPVQEKP
jgi:hypothetical protein